ncbi:hypothetical protein [Rubellicoccus peritrichatus]|uniref:Tetratricopeptide repeat protein n=1 Tax=Rubellicoccus peritrichatus TaxID=3080537 RepID=A0AAQ3LAN7_9BACT|nr:hypothetical protein [Puniceicoccus sp. CR14]WOO42350.1 hypothetical protein RZN69_04555 [Puniceicoccus sp. CR14]
MMGTKVLNILKSSLVSLLVLVFVPSTNAQSQPVEDFDILSEPVNLVLKNGRSLRGQAMDIENNSLVFEGASGAGEVEYTFSHEEISRLDFPGNELAVKANSYLNNGDPDSALPILDALYRQRVRFFRFMPPNEVAFFQKLSDTAYRTGDYYLAVGVARNVRPYVENPIIKRQLDDRELLAHYHLPLLEKTQSLADSWIAEWEPYSASALGWYVLGQLAFDREEFDNALWLSLKPVVFSSQFPMEYLDHCYALAIVAAVKIEDYTEAQRLLDEMQRRRMSWPTAPKLEPYLDYFDSIPEPKTESAKG